MKVKDKPKFDKSRCYRCIYSTNQISGSYKTKDKNGKVVGVACDYATITGNTCLIDTSEGTYDLRGTEYSNCKLFKEK